MHCKQQLASATVLAPSSFILLDGNLVTTELLRPKKLLCAVIRLTRSWLHSTEVTPGMITHVFHCQHVNFQFHVGRGESSVRSASRPTAPSTPEQLHAAGPAAPSAPGRGVPQGERHWSVLHLEGTHGNSEVDDGQLSERSVLLHILMLAQSHGRKYSTTTELSMKTDNSKVKIMQVKTM